MNLHRYWLRFSFQDGDRRPIGTAFGCGVTAYSVDDALGLVQDRVFDGFPVPRVVELVEDVDIATLDSAHVRPNMGNVAVRGIWFPLGYE